jgi:hypothetical protein
MNSQNAKGPAEAATSPDRGSITHPCMRKEEMNEVTNTTASEDALEWTDEEVVKLREAASVKWHQWEHTDNPAAWTPPTNDEWVGAINPHLFIVRLAFASMFQSRRQTMTTLQGLEADSLHEELLEGISDAIEFFKPILDTLKAAEARFIIAAATISLEKMGETA